jgi:hypothetical protein
MNQNENHHSCEKVDANGLVIFVGGDQLEREETFLRVESSSCSAVSKTHVGACARLRAVALFSVGSSAFADKSEVLSSGSKIHARGRVTVVDGDLGSSAKTLCQS